MSFIGLVLLSPLNFALLFLLSALFYVKRKGNPKRKWLNGPINLPVIGGNLAFISNVIRWKKMTYSQQLGSHCERYGPVCGFYNGSMYVVVCQDFNFGKEVLKSAKFEAHFPATSFVQHFYGGMNFGLVHSHGKTSYKLRESTLHNLRKYGHGNKLLFNKIILQNADTILETLSKQSMNGPIIVKGMFTIPILQILFTLLSGKRHADEEQLQKFVNRAHYLYGQSYPSLGLLSGFPFLRHIPGLPTYNTFKGFVKQCEEVTQIIKSIIKEKRKNGNYQENPEDFIDGLLQQQMQGTNPYLTERQIIFICVDIIVAGLLEYVPNYLEWAILYMILYPDIQQKVAEEIDKVIGKDGTPNIKDQSRMPYTTAVLLEVSRLGSIFHQLLRSPLQDVEVNGYFIPKESTVMTDVKTFHMDEAVWGDPKIFRPERFLDENHCIINSKKLYSFGTGFRTCIAEPISKSTSFIFLTMMLQKYQLNKAPGSKDLSTESKDGIVGGPSQFSIQVSRRL